jgi:phosphoserine aminotransferase
MEKQSVVFFTPGPAQLYPTTKKHVQTALDTDICSISHRSKLFQEIFSTTIANIKKLFNIPKDYHVFFLSSGTEAMALTILNCVNKESFHFVNGSFSKRFFIIAQELRKQPKKMEVDFGKGFDLSNVNIPESAEVVCFTHNETSTGVFTPLEEVYPLRERYPDKLFALDIVSSAPYANIDFAKFDCVFFSVQKGFGLPAGLGVIALSPRAMKKAIDLHEKGINIGSYHNFPILLHYAKKNQTHETPPVLQIYLLGKVLEDMLEKGIANIRQETDAKAKVLYDFFDNHPRWSVFVKEKKFRSPTVITVHTGDETAKIKLFLTEKGMPVGGGYGVHKETQIRIANFPTHTMKQMQELLTLLSV